MVRWTILMLTACLSQASAQDYAPQDLGLRYVGVEGGIPVTVELTLRERLDGVLEYAQWVTPRAWATWFRRSTVVRAQLGMVDGTFVPLQLDIGDGPQEPPNDLTGGTIDRLTVRLRARADIARGLKSSEYVVWTGGEAFETWTLEVSGPQTVRTPDGTYETLRFTLGTEADWIEGWSAPLLLFHFVKLVRWQDGRKTGTWELAEKQL